MTSTELEDQFSQEMKIITNDKRLSNHKRHQRLIQLIERVEDDPEKDLSKKKSQLNAQIIGTDLIWARARFDQSQIQANKFNKLSFTVFSKLSAPIKIESLEIVLDQQDLNKTVNFVTTQGQPFSLKKQSPLSFECDFYVDQENSLLANKQQMTVKFNEIKLKICGPKHIDFNFCVKPFLAPTPAEQLKQVKRLNAEVYYSVIKLPHKVKAEITTETKEQALVGDPFRVKIRLLKDSDILLTEIRAKISSI